MRVVLDDGSEESIGKEAARDQTTAMFADGLSPP